MAISKILTITLLCFGTSAFAADPCDPATQCIFESLTKVTNITAAVDLKLSKLRPKGCSFNELGDTVGGNLIVKVLSPISKEAANENRAISLRDFKQIVDIMLLELNCKDSTQAFTKETIQQCLTSQTKDMLQERKKGLFVGLIQLKDIHRKNPKSFEGIDGNEILNLSCDKPLQQCIDSKN